ncbi:MAG: DUF234 domain-containing protein [Anaerolineales bacterium]
MADYLRRWKDIADLKTNIAAIFLSDESPYRNESEVLISDVLRRKSPDYAAVLSAVARGLHDLADIATNAVLASDRTAGVLDTLLDLRLVEKRIRASVPPERQAQARYARYFLADPFLRFYYRFIEPNRTLIAERDFKEVLSLIEQQLRPFVAETFEELCREWTRQQGLRNQLPFRPEYVSSDWFGSEYQADVVAVNWRQAQVFVGEAKWGESLVDMPVYRALLERLPRVTKRMPHKKDWTTHAALFARKGFTRAVIEAARREHVRLVAFADMVRDLQTPR